MQRISTRRIGVFEAKSEMKKIGARTGIKITAENELASFAVGTRELMRTQQATTKKYEATTSVRLWSKLIGSREILRYSAGISALVMA